MYSAATDSDEIEKYLKSDDALFHYTKNGIALEKIFPFKLLKFGPLCKTDDPYEYNLKVISASGWGPLKGWEFVSPSIDKYISQRTYFISFCMNDDKNNLGYEKPRMWSQYGEKNKGICLVFSKEKIEEEINQFNSLKIFNAFSEKVRYSSELKNPIINAIGNINEVDVLHHAMEYIRKNYQALYFTKHVDYAGENEYRAILVAEDDAEQDLNINLLPALKYIIIGDNYPEAYYPLLVNYQEILQVPVCKLMWYKDRFILIKEFYKKQETS